MRPGPRGGRLRAMNEIVTRPRASYGPSMLVAAGWYATAVAAVIAGLSGDPVRPQEDCSAMFSCLSPVEALGIWMAVAGVWVFGVLLLATLGITALTARLTGSPIVAGTFAAFGGVALCGGLLATYLAVR